MHGTLRIHLRKRSKTCMDGAYEGRFILSADCAVPPSTTDENMKAVVRAAKDAEKVLFGK